MTRRKFLRSFTLISCFAAALLAPMSFAWAAPPEIIAHRGASDDAPENTLAAIRLAWEQQADAVEFDVHLSKDGQIVLMHDADTKRTAGVDRKVVDQTLAELRKLDVGSWKSARYKGERVPSLAEALAEISKGKRAFIEVKCGPEIVPELKRVVQASKLDDDQMAIISFKTEVVAAAKAALPNLKAYWVVDPKPATKTKPATWTADALLAKAREARADGLDLSAHPVVQPVVSAEFIRRAKDENLQVYVWTADDYIWTVDDAAVAKEMAAAGVLGITTNRPAWLRKHLTK